MVLTLFVIIALRNYKDSYRLLQLYHRISALNGRISASERIFQRKHGVIQVKPCSSSLSPVEQIINLYATCFSGVMTKYSSVLKYGTLAMKELKKAKWEQNPNISMWVASLDKTGASVIRTNSDSTENSNNGGDRNEGEGEQIIGCICLKVSKEKGNARKDSSGHASDQSQSQRPSGFISTETEEVSVVDKNDDGEPKVKGNYLLSATSARVPTGDSGTSRSRENDPLIERGEVLIGELSFMCVLPEFRRLGIARLLTTQVSSGRMYIIYVLVQLCVYECMLSCLSV